MSSPAASVCVLTPRQRTALIGLISQLALMVTLALWPLPLFADGAIATPPASLGNAQRVQQVVDDLRSQLSVSREVTASIVAENPLVVSVQPSRERAGAFQLSFEERFLDLLNEDELRAVIAHELGHVWIFSHHPYLQTERLANSIAMRVVSRDSLTQVYLKLSEHGGKKVHLARALGD